MRIVAFLFGLVHAVAASECDSSSAQADDIRVFFDMEIDNNPIGRLVFRLFRTSPITVENFRQFARGTTIKSWMEAGNMTFYHYKGTHFHRIMPGFMAQGGDVVSDGTSTGSVSIYGDSFKDEHFRCHHTRRGLISMANVGPNTNGCQFFITMEPTPWLDGRHHVFGEIESGHHVLDNLEQYGTPGGDTTSKVKIADSGEIIDGQDVREHVQNGCPDGICLINEELNYTHKHWINDAGMHLYNDGRCGRMFKICHRM